MSRFSGWTSAAVEKLGKISHEKEVPELCKSYVENYGKKLCKKYVPDYCAPIVSALQMLGINAVREYRFLHDRRFRFDIAIPEHRIAIEFEGGIFESKCKKCNGKGCASCKFTGRSTGGHTRGKIYSDNCKKYNLAVMHGWKLLRYTTDRTKKLNWEFEIADEIKGLISSLAVARIG